MNQPWVFMGIDRSHFSAKVRPALNYKQLHYVEYPPDMALISERTGVAFIPILISPDDEVFQDSTDIIDVLDQRVQQRPLVPQGVDRAVCRLFELYADEFFPMVSMRTRWAYAENFSEMQQAFAAFSGSQERGQKTDALMSSFLPALGITEQTMPAIDAHTDEILSLLSEHFDQYPFVLGDRLTLADCALMGPLYAHLYLDRVTRQQLYERALPVCMWIERCNRPVPTQMTDTFDGQYPASLLAVIELIRRDALPLLAASHAAFTEWATQHAQADVEVPRAVGTYDGELRGVAVNAATRSYVSWKIQRFVESAAQLEAPALTQLLGDTASSWLVGVQPSLVKRDFKLVVAD